MAKDLMEGKVRDSMGKGLMVGKVGLMGDLTEDSMAAKEDKEDSMVDKGDKEDKEDLMADKEVLMEGKEDSMVDRAVIMEGKVLAVGVITKAI